MDQLEELNLKFKDLKNQILRYFIIFLFILGWIFYKSIDGVAGYFVFFIIFGLCTLAIWSIPYIGLIFMLLNVVGVISINLYDGCLNIVNLTPSLLTDFHMIICNLVGFALQIKFDLQILGDFKSKRDLRRKIHFKNYALINCRIIDGNKDSPIIEDGIILVENAITGRKHNDNDNDNYDDSYNDKDTIGKIKAVGRSEDIEVPDGYKIIDLKGKYIMPGLINAHCHLSGSGRPTNLFKVGDRFMEKVKILLQSRYVQKLIFKTMKKNAITALNSGVTTLRILGEPVYIDVKLRDKIAQNKLIGPRLMVAGQSLACTGGHGIVISYIVDSKTEIRKAIRKNAREKVDWTKLISTGGVMDARKLGEAGRPEMVPEEIETAVMESHRANLMVASHSESTQGILEALESGVDTIEHGAELSPEIIRLFKHNSKSLRGYSALIPTISAGMGIVQLPMDFTRITKETHENAKLILQGSIRALQQAYKEKIKLGVGNDASVPYVTHYDLWRELYYFVYYTGMSPQEAIYYATKGNAEILGIDGITGSIEPGKSADMIIVSDNPLEDITRLKNIEHVIIKGIFLKRPKLKKIKKIEDHTIPQPYQIS
ncbi:MAG: amidohydrolase family protein [Promethearchaeota archaeon]